MITLLRGCSLPRQWRWTAALGFGSVFLLNMPSPAEGLYWLIGALAYTMPIIGTCLLLVLWVEKSRIDSSLWRRICYGLSILLAFLLPGFSEIAACAALSLAIVVVLGQWQNSQAFSQRSWWVLPAAATLGAVLTLAAPGNYVKANQTLTSISWLEALGRALSATAYMLLNWLGNVPLLLASLLYLTIGKWIAVRPNTTQAALLSRLTIAGWAGPLAGMLILFSSNLLCFLAINQPPPARCRNVLLFLFLICWVVTLQAIIQSRWCISLLQVTRPLQLLGVPVLLLLGLSDFNPGLRHEAINRHFSPIATAYQEWLSGQWLAYDMQQMRRRRLVQNSNAPWVVVPTLTVRPSTLFYWDLSANPKMWSNQAFATAFGKQAIWVTDLPVTNASTAKSR
ncbi:MAG: DUF6056 family protein [Janthinobacterium lividum]